MNMYKMLLWILYNLTFRRNNHNSQQWNDERFDIEFDDDDDGDDDDDHKDDDDGGSQRHVIGLSQFLWFWIMFHQNFLHILDDFYEQFKIIYTKYS